MRINGMDFDLERAAYDIGRMAAKRAMTEAEALEDGEIVNMLQAYVNAAVQVMSMTQSEIEALMR